MHTFSGAMSLLGSSIAVILAYAGTTMAASGTLEVDLVFPQNDTYAPAHIVPVAFAFQNSDLAGYLQPSLTFTINPYGNYTKAIANGYFQMTWANFTDSNPYMEYGEAFEVLNTEGVWSLDWQLSITNCSSPDNLKFTTNTKLNRVVFTTKNGAKVPDLTAATAKDTCSNSQGFTFGITETLDSGIRFDNGRPCAVFADSTPTPSPCGVKIDTAAAANVSASFTARACAVETASWCPKVDSASQNMMVPSLVVGGVSFLAAAAGGLGFLVI
jgi:hypothetical protein